MLFYIIRKIYLINISIFQSKMHLLQILLIAEACAHSLRQLEAFDDIDPHPRGPHSIECQVSLCLMKLFEILPTYCLFFIFFGKMSYITFLFLSYYPYRNHQKKKQKKSKLNKKDLSIFLFLTKQGYHNVNNNVSCNSVAHILTALIWTPFLSSVATSPSMKSNRDLFFTTLLKQKTT